MIRNRYQTSFEPLLLEIVTKFHETSSNLIEDKSFLKDCYDNKWAETKTLEALGYIETADPIDRSETFAAIVLTEDGIAYFPSRTAEIDRQKSSAKIQWVLILNAITLLLTALAELDKIIFNLSSAVSIILKFFGA